MSPIYACKGNALASVEFGDCRDTMRRWAAQGVKAQMCVTSPPYFGLRDYGHEGQLGLEQTPDEYVAAMVEVFRCVRDVLADDGTLWLNIGDSYARTGGTDKQPSPTATVGNTRATLESMPDRKQRAPLGLKEKDLIGIPWMLAFALRADGWYLRQDIIWHKPNPMPESVTDRCTKAHEYVFLLSKSAKYFIDPEGLREAAVGAVAGNTKPTKAGRAYEDGASEHRTAAGLHKWAERQRAAKGNRKTFRGGGVYTQGQSFENHTVAQNDSVGNAPNESRMRNRRSVWTVATRPYKGAHFATFPPALIEPCILAGSRPGDVVLDPFMGSGTTAAVALQHGRHALGCELNPAYAPLMQERLA